jgi:hypothetical protein
MGQTLPKAPEKQMYNILAQTSSITPKKLPPQSQTMVKQSPKVPKFIDFVYDHDFDENGIFFHLGSYGKRRPW